MFQRVGAAAYKNDLSNITYICNLLGNPQNKLKYIHIAGTNGKGSVSNMLAAIFQKHGYKTGLFTSPHLVDFRERIKINGRNISKSYIIKFVQEHEKIFNKIKPSFFEWTTALAFQYFYDKQTDIVILETGMGGRLDSTNIITPELSIITNIGEDHKQFLGNTLKKIAIEKAGIIKQHVPIIISEHQPEVKSVFIKQAKQNKAPIFFARDLIKIHSTQYIDNVLRVTYLERNNNQGKNILSSKLSASYQENNIRAVLAACTILKKQFKLKTSVIHKAIQHTPKITNFRGRWEVIQKYPYIVLDIAHNKQGIQAALKHLKHYQYKNLRVVIGVVKDKDIKSILQLLPKQAVYYFTQANIPRALDVTELKNIAQQYHLKGNTYNKVYSAIKQAKKEALKEDLILIFGSAFIVADACKIFK